MGKSWEKQSLGFMFVLTVQQQGIFVTHLCNNNMSPFHVASSPRYLIAYGDTMVDFSTFTKSLISLFLFILGA